MVDITSATRQQMASSKGGGGKFGGLSQFFNFNAVLKDAKRQADYKLLEQTRKIKADRENAELLAGTKNVQTDDEKDLAYAYQKLGGELGVKAMFQNYQDTGQDPSPLIEKINLLVEESKNTRSGVVPIQNVPSSAGDVASGGSSFWQGVKDVAKFHPVVQLHPIAMGRRIAKNPDVQKKINELINSNIPVKKIKAYLKEVGLRATDILGYDFRGIKK